MNMNIKASTLLIQRSCKINPNMDCEDCKKKDCPFIYCKNIDCMECLERYMCPMCQGNCKKCDKQLLCKICDNFAE